MIVYFADRNLNIMGQASINLPKGLMIINDTKTENLDSGHDRRFGKIGTEDIRWRKVVMSCCSGSSSSFIMKT